MRVKKHAITCALRVDDSLVWEYPATSTIPVRHETVHVTSVGRVWLVLSNRCRVRRGDLRPHPENPLRGTAHQDLETRISKLEVLQRWEKLREKILRAKFGAPPPNTTVADIELAARIIGLGSC